VPIVEAKITKKNALWQVLEAKITKKMADMATVGLKNMKYVN
jgi:hypothetical protein